jgi:hypothetical protein
MRRHRLVETERSDDPAAIAASLVALHASDPSSVYLSASARMATPSIGAVAAVLHDSRSLVRFHAMRRTLWVSTPAVARSAMAAMLDVARTERKKLLGFLQDAGVAEPEAWLAAANERVLAVLRERGPMTTRRIGDLVPELRTPLRVGVGTRNETTVTAHARVLLLLGFDGVIVRTEPIGAWTTSEYAWSDAAAWLPGGLSGGDPDAGAHDIAARYLHAFGPVTTGDLQWWTGWTVGRTRAALARIGAVPVDVDGEPAWLAADDVDPVAGAKSVALLPALDATAMGWRGRDWYLDPAHVAALFDRSGNAGPTVWMDGRIVGGWMQRRDGAVVHRLLEPVPAARARQIEGAARRLEALVGDARVNVRFPAPLQKELA